MKKTTIGKLFSETGAKALEVSVLCFGAAGFGPFEREKENISLLEDFIGAGGNFIDTARVYGLWMDSTKTSYSERILGRWEGRRNCVISTKGAHPDAETGCRRVTPDDISYDIGQSLQALNLDSLDIYFLHRDDISVPISVIMDELNRHCEKGRINLLGASNWTAGRIYEANDYCVCHGLRGFDISQICYNIMLQTPAQWGDTTLVSMNENEKKFYTDLQMPVMAFSSQAGGFVNRFFNTPDGDIVSPMATEDNLKKLDRIRFVCREKNLSPTEVTLGYLLSQELDVIPIIGVSSEKHLTEALGASETVIDGEILSFIDG